MAAAHQRTAVLLDPYPLWLDALGRVLEGIGIRVMLATTEPDRALEAIESERPDLFVTEVDTHDAELDGFTCVRRALAAVDGLRAIVLAARTDPQSVDAALAAGAAAYVIKTTEAADLASAIRVTFDHSIFLRGIASVPGAATPEPTDDGVSRQLTRRELEILKLVAEGRSNSDVARTLWVTEQTVKFHLSNIYRKLGVSNRTEASRWAQVHGLLSAAVRPAAE